MLGAGTADGASTPWASRSMSAPKANDTPSAYRAAREIMRGPVAATLTGGGGT